MLPPISFLIGPLARVVSLLLVSWALVFSACQTTGTSTPATATPPTPAMAGTPRGVPGSLKEAVNMTESLRRMNVRADVLLITPIGGRPHATSAFQHRGTTYVWDSRWGAARMSAPYSPAPLAAEWLIHFGIPGQERLLDSANFAP